MIPELLTEKQLKRLYLAYSPGADSKLSVWEEAFLGGAHAALNALGIANTITAGIEGAGVEGCPLCRKCGPVAGRDAYECGLTTEFCNMHPSMCPLYAGAILVRLGK